MAKLTEDMIIDLVHYGIIRQIVGEWNKDYFCKKSKEEYFDMILATFPRDKKDCVNMMGEKDFITFMEERGFG